MTFEQWVGIWVDSGKFHLRGVHSENYCMARYNDHGPYMIGNVRICTVRENHAERWHEGARREQAEAMQRNEHGRANKGRKFSEEHRAKLTEARRRRGTDTYA